jgi:hypothetical protein
VSLNSLKAFLFLDFDMVHTPLAGLYDGTTATRAIALLRALGDHKPGRKLTKKEQGGPADAWTPYLPPADGHTQPRCPNGMLIKFLNSYITA